MKIHMPDYVKSAIKTLNSNGFEAFAVGGAVRDCLLGKAPDDWDVATNALTDDIKACFSRHFDTGIKHGTITVLIDKIPVEITTYRIEGEYENNRRPRSVSFTSNIEEDLKRRDFTINAMAYNDEKGLVDLFGGAQDLPQRLIRCVGNPDERFTEDALRIMRAVRFAARFNFEIEADTMASLKRNCHLLKNISAERIQAELVKTLVTGNRINILFESGIMNIIAPEITSCDVDFVNSVCTDSEIKLAALLTKAGISEAREFFNRLKFDNKTKNNTLSILKAFGETLPNNDEEMRKMLCAYGKNIASKVIELQKPIDSARYNDLKTLLENNKDKPHKLNMLDINGNDLIAAGITGTDIGNVMESLLDVVVKDPDKNIKSMLLNIAKNIKHN